MIYSSVLIDLKVIRLMVGSFDLIFGLKVTTAFLILTNGNDVSFKSFELLSDQEQKRVGENDSEHDQDLDKAGPSAERREVQRGGEGESDEDPEEPENHRDDPHQLLRGGPHLRQELCDQVPGRAGEPPQEPDHQAPHREVREPGGADLRGGQDPGLPRQHLRAKKEQGDAGADDASRDGPQQVSHLRGLVTPDYL